MFASIIVLATTHGMSVDLYGGLGPKISFTQSGETTFFTSKAIFENNHGKDHPSFDVALGIESLIGMKFANRFGIQITTAAGSINTNIESVNGAYLDPSGNTEIIQDIDISHLNYFTGIMGVAYKIKNTGNFQPFTAAGIGMIKLAGITFADPTNELGFNFQLGFDKKIIDTLSFSMKYDLLAITPTRFFVSEYYQDGVTLPSYNTVNQRKKVTSNISQDESIISEMKTLYPGDEIVRFSHLYNHSILLGIKFNF